MEASSSQEPALTLSLKRNQDSNGIWKVDKLRWRDVRGGGRGCQTIKFMVEDGCADGVIPLPNVSSVIFSKVINYCKKHADHEDQTATADKKLRQWEADSIKVNQSTLCGLLMAANYLNIPSLVELSCQRIPDMIKGKTADDIRKTFNIEKDFSPEEEAEIRQEFQRVFQ